MSVYRSEAPVWFREQIARWMRNYGKQRAIVEQEMDDWWKRLRHLDEEAVCRLVDSVMNDDSVQKFPQWSQVRRRVGGESQTQIDEIDFSRMIVWSPSGEWRGTIEGLTFEHRHKLAMYVAHNLYPGPPVSQVEFIKALDPDVYELIRKGGWKLPAKEPMHV